MINGYDDHPPHPELKGIYVYLKIVHLYIDIFQSKHTALAKKVQAASTVVAFLDLWFNHIRTTQGLDTKQHFITQQTYQDVVLSCHTSVSVVAFMRDNFPQLPCTLSLMGTDIVESFWSKMGQWVGNRHNYSFGDLKQNYRHMIRLEEIRLEPNAPQYAKPHPKQESVWNRQYIGVAQADLSDYPSSDQV